MPPRRGESVLSRQTEPVAARKCKRCSGRGLWDTTRNGVAVDETCPACRGSGRITPERYHELILAEVRSRQENDRVLLEYIVAALDHHAAPTKVLSLVAHSLQARMKAFDPSRPEAGYLAREGAPDTR